MTIFDQVQGQKQTNEDFEPAPAEIVTSFGALDFELEAFPTEDTARKLYDELDLQPETSAADVDGWDSIATVELMVLLEKEFKIRFRTGEMARLANIGQLHDRIVQHLPG